jgi:two-component system NtrC family sensor kinase
MFYSTRSKLIASFLGVSFLVGAVSLLVGGQLLYQSVLNEAKNRVRMDLNAAHEVYQSRVKLVKVSLNITTLGYGFIAALKEKATADLVERINRMARYAELDFAGVVNRKGEAICKIGPDPIPDKRVHVSNPMSELALETRVPVSGTVILSREFLFAENPELADQARISVVSPSSSGKTEEKEEMPGMALAAAIPVFDGGEMIGVLYGGILVNRSVGVVDTVRDTVFLNETYKGRTFGAASVFFKDIRISTNVMTLNGKRAFGTKASNQVREHVLQNGDTWTERALVISNWYITAYEPIEDIFGNRVGMLGLGVLEQKYVDLRREALSVFILITVLSMLLAAGLGWLLAAKIMFPVRRLIKASRQVSEGSLSPDIGRISKGEIGVLQTTFQEMVKSMGRRRAQAENQLLHSEKQASVGRLAAGVAHEINNPLTGVLSFTHMLLRRKDLNDEVRADLQTIAEATERVRKIVKGLLDFSRQTALDREPTDVNRLIKSTVSLMENQALVKGVSMSFAPGKDLPILTLDRSQLQSALLNIIINALDATEPGGNITVNTGISISAKESSQKGVEISITDTGSGIPPENMDKLFDPFFTTKGVGQGTGLGLAVSFGIVQRHRGSIRVQSEPGKGSTFIVWLPIEEKTE